MLLAVALTGLAAVPRAGAAGEMTDMLGRRVRVPDHAVRIVSLAPSITETVFVLGDGDRLVGVTDYCDYPPEATRKPRVGGISTPSFEAILALRPDLVIATSESNYAEHVERLVVARPARLRGPARRLRDRARVDRAHRRGARA